MPRTPLKRASSPRALSCSVSCCAIQEGVYRRDRSDDRRKGTREGNDSNWDDVGGRAPHHEADQKRYTRISPFRGSSCRSSITGLGASVTQDLLSMSASSKGKYQGVLVAFIDHQKRGDACCRPLTMLRSSRICMLPLVLPSISAAMRSACAFCSRESDPLSSFVVYKFSSKVLVTLKSLGTPQGRGYKKAP